MVQESPECVALTPGGPLLKELRSQQGEDNLDEEYGFADWQLEALWKRAEEDNHFRLDVEDGDASDSDFGISERQIEVAMSRAVSGEQDQLALVTGEPQEMPGSPQDAAPDPLRQFQQQRRRRRASEPARWLPRLTLPTSRGGTDCVLDRGSSPSNAIHAALTAPEPTQPLQAPHAGVSSVASEPCPSPGGAEDRLRVVLASSRRLRGITFYLFIVREPGNVDRYYMKRYSDFLALDRQLRESHAAMARPDAPRSIPRSKAVVIPKLPPKGALGLRHMWNLGDFNVKRQSGLQRYAEGLVQQIRSIDDVSELEEFFGPQAKGRVGLRT